MTLMTLNSVMALTLRYFAKFGSYRGPLRKMVKDTPKLFGIKM